MDAVLLWDLRLPKTSFLVQLCRRFNEHLRCGSIIIIQALDTTVRSDAVLSFPPAPSHQFNAIFFHNLYVNQLRKSLKCVNNGLKSPIILVFSFGAICVFCRRCFFFSNFFFVFLRPGRSLFLFLPPSLSVSLFVSPSPTRQHTHHARTINHSGIISFKAAELDACQPLGFHVFLPSLPADTLTVHYGGGAKWQQSRNTYLSSHRWRSGDLLAGASNESAVMRFMEVSVWNSCPAGP